MTHPPDRIIRSRRRDLGRPLNTLLDNLFRRAAVPADPSAFPDASTILNNGTGSIFPGMIYGRNSTGKVARAIATASNTVEPLWIAISQAGRGQEFVAATSGTLELAVQGGSGASNPASKAMAYLSLSAAGKITFVRPSGSTNIRFYIGRAAKRTILGSGKVLVDFNLALLGSETL